MKLSHEVYKYCGLNQITGHVTDLVQMIFLGQFSTMWYELGFPLATDRRTFKCISAVRCTFYLFFVRIKLLRRFKFRDFLWVFLPLISNISMSIFSANSDEENHLCSHLRPLSLSSQFPSRLPCPFSISRLPPLKLCPHCFHVKNTATELCRLICAFPLFFFHFFWISYHFKP